MVEAFSLLVTGITKAFGEFVKVTRRGYSIQKRLVELTRYSVSPSGVCISRYTSVITCAALSTLVRWMGAHHCKVS